METNIFNGLGDYVYVPLKLGGISPMFETQSGAWHYANNNGVEYVVEKKRLSDDRLTGVFSTIAMYQEVVDSRILAGENPKDVLKDYKAYLKGVAEGGRITVTESYKIFNKYKTEIEPLISGVEEINPTGKKLVGIFFEKRTTADGTSYEVQLPDLEDVAPTTRYNTTLTGAYAFAKYLDSRRIPYEFNEGKSPLVASIEIESIYNDEGVKHAFACIQK